MVVKCATNIYVVHVIFRRQRYVKWVYFGLFAERPNTLSTSGKKKRKIKVNPDILNLADDMDDKSLSSLSNESEGEDIMSPLDDIATPDDIETPDDLEDSTYSRT